MPGARVEFAGLFIPRNALRPRYKYPPTIYGQAFPLSPHKDLDVAEFYSVGLKQSVETIIVSVGFSGLFKVL